MQFVRRWLPVLLWAAVILSASNDSFSAERSGSWFRAVFGFELPYAIHMFVRKASHIIEYSILGALAWRAQRGFIVPLGITLLVASVDETLQTMTATRTGSIADIALDLCSAILAVALCHRFGVR